VQVMVVNAQHIKAVPGRKTDIKDAEWIADLLQHGLLRPSFIPPAWQRIVRELTRSRTSLSEERSRVIARLQKGLEDANIKLAAVASDVMGKSARAVAPGVTRRRTDARGYGAMCAGQNALEAGTAGAGPHWAPASPPSLLVSRALEASLRTAGWHCSAQYRDCCASATV
jgi:Transposase